MYHILLMQRGWVNAYHQMQLSVILRIPLFRGGRLLTFCKGILLSYSKPYWHGVIYKEFTYIWAKTTSFVHSFYHSGSFTCWLLVLFMYIFKMVAIVIFISWKCKEHQLAEIFPNYINSRKQGKYLKKRTWSGAKKKNWSI